MLIEDTVQTAKVQQLAKIQSATTPEQRAKTYHRLVLQGKLRLAVRYLTDQESSGVLMLSNQDAKTRVLVIDVLQSKHPQTRAPTLEDLVQYSGKVPVFVTWILLKKQ